MTTTMTTRTLAAKSAAVLGIAGAVMVSFAPAAPVFAGDPPSWAHHDDNRRSDDHKNDRRDDHKDVQHDKRDIRNDDARLRRDQNELHSDRRDERHDNRYDDRYDDRYNNDHNTDWRNNDRYHTNDRRSDGFRDRVDQVRQQDTNRQNNKNDWRNLTLLGGAATVYGVLNHDPTVAFIGAAGTLYSASRYEQDRHSQSQNDRARAELFERGSFERDGVRYTKRDRWNNGQHYYYFAR